MGFSRQEYWSGLLCPPSGDRPDLGIEPTSLSLLHGQAGSLPLARPGKPPCFIHSSVYTSVPDFVLSLSSLEVRLASFLRGRVQRAFGDLVLGCLPAWLLALSAEYPGRCASDGPHSFL